MRLYYFFSQLRSLPRSNRAEPQGRSLRDGACALAT